jgi:hypothetical protein
MRRAVLSLTLALAAMPATAIEEPRFETLRRSGDFELRRYAPMIVAETFVQGDLSEASGEGFRVIAGYIFGNNVSVRGTGSEKVAMTAPVTTEAASEKIAMTAPVTLEAASMGSSTAAPASGEGAAQGYRMHFVMPSAYTLETLPRPRDARVRLREIPAQRMAVIRFSGFAGEDKVRERTNELLGWLRSEGLQPAGSAQLARYDPPWTLPFLRRNEVMVPLD